MDWRAVREGVPLLEQLGQLHGNVQRDHPSIRRIAVATHDTDNHRLRTFIHSTDGPNPLSLYEARRDHVPSLVELAGAPAPRVIDDLRRLPEPHGEHTRRLLEAGFRSSLTVPVVEAGQVRGFRYPLSE